MTIEEENNLICEKLLGWSHVKDGFTVTHIIDPPRVCFWRDPATGWFHIAAPSFTDWASAGLILDVLRKIDVSQVKIGLFHNGRTGFWRAELRWNGCEINVVDESSGPLVIRSVALNYLRSIHESRN